VKTQDHVVRTVLYTPPLPQRSQEPDFASSGVELVIAVRGSSVAHLAGMTKSPVSRPWDQDDDSEYSDGAELPLAVRVAFGLIAWTGDVVGEVLEAVFDNTKM